MRTEKESTHKEMTYEWIENELYHQMSRNDQRLRKLTLRYLPGSWLAVILMAQDDEMFVGFVGASTLHKLIMKLKKEVDDDIIRWKIDELADRA